jgi:hypothetical protein
MPVGLEVEILEFSTNELVECLKYSSHISEVFR